MADRVNIPVKIATPEGAVFTPQAASANGNKVYNNGNTIVTITNGGSSSITVTVKNPAKGNGQTADDITLSVAADGVATFSHNLGWNQLDGYVYYDFSAVTDVTMLAVSS